MTDADESARSGRTAWVILASLLIVVLAVASALLGARLWRAGRLDAARADALHAARQEAVNLLSPDYRRIDATITNVLAGATGDFHGEYARDAAQVKEVVTKNQVSATGTALAAGVESSDLDSVTVLVVADSTVRNKADQGGQLRHFRIRMEMSRQGGRWRARTLAFVS